MELGACNLEFQKNNMVLVYAESPKGKFKKAAFEAVTYGHKTAQAMGTQCIALTIGAVEDAGQLGKYGAAQVLNVSNDSLSCLLYTSPSPRDQRGSRMPSSA